MSAGTSAMNFVTSTMRNLCENARFYHPDFGEPFRSLCFCNCVVPKMSQEAFVGFEAKEKKPRN